MGKIVISENVSLDGAVQDPTGEEGSRHGGWFGQVGDKDREEWAKVEFEEALGAEALLLGRRSDEYFGPRWTGRGGEWADRLNGLPKYVVSSTLVNPEWSNSTVLKGEVVNEVSKLKQELDGEIVVYASRQLVHTLMEHDLVEAEPGAQVRHRPFITGQVPSRHLAAFSSSRSAARRAGTCTDQPIRCSSTSIPASVYSTPNRRQTWPATRARVQH